MRRIDAVLRGSRDWSPEERQSIDDVLDAALEWSEGRLPLDFAAQAGSLPNARGYVSDPGYGRVRAIVSADLDDPRRAALMAMFDALIARQNRVNTKHGSYAPEELRQAGYAEDAHGRWVHHFWTGIKDRA